MDEYILLIDTKVLVNSNIDVDNLIFYAGFRIFLGLNS